MDLIYKTVPVDHSVRSILAFANEEQSDFWSEPLFHFYPQIDKTRYLQMDASQRQAYLQDFFTCFSRENEALLREKVEAYNRHWQAHRPQIVAALEDAFSVDLSGKFDHMVGNISFNPICPRFLESSSFDIFYLSSERGALGLSIHEIIHFVWFHVWQELFHDDPAEYEAPHLKWILSEMVVQPIMGDDRLWSINPYRDQCVYPYFYTLELDERPILERLNELYHKLPIRDFMRESYQLCLDHEREIRRHIAASEESIS